MANTLNVSQALKAPGQVFPFSATIEVADADVFGETVRFSPAEATGTLLGAGETVSVRGELRCEAAMACARCLRPVSYTHLGQSAPEKSSQISPWKPILAPILCPFWAKMKMQKIRFTKTQPNM